MKRVLKFAEWRQKKKEKLQNEFLIQTINKVAKEFFEENREKASWVIFGGGKKYE